jgi:hypothetical protein
MMRFLLHLLVVGSLIHRAAAFLASLSNAVVSRKDGKIEDCLGSQSGSGHDESAGKPTVTRTSFMEEALGASVGISLVLLNPPPVFASGGATAGGAYLLSG